MERSKTIFVGKCLAILSAVPLLVYALATGPPARVTGVPGEGVCAQAGCHVGIANSGPGRVEVTFPDGLTYAPGVPQQLTVTITDDVANVHGFQLTARLASNLLNGQAGTLAAAPGETGIRVICSNDLGRPADGCPATDPVEFIEHSLPRAANTFNVQWTPPATDVGPVRIFVAGNAANGDGQPTGDRIYTANYTLQPEAAVENGPQVAANGVLNGASFLPGIAPNSWISIFGENLAPTTRTWDGEIVNGRLPTQLDGVSVTVGDKPAAVHFISPGQINALVPDDIGLGSMTVQVTTPQGTVTATTVAQQHAPAWFMRDPENRKFVAATHADGSVVGRPNLIPGAVSRPARPGEVIVLWGAGFGPTIPPTPSGEVVTTPREIDRSQLSVRIGNMPAQVTFAGITIAGVHQINIVMPDVPDGDAAVVAEIGGLRTQDNAFITVQRPTGGGAEDGPGDDDPYY